MTTHTIKRKRTLKNITVKENVDKLETNKKQKCEIKMVNIETNTDKQLKDYKMFVFDLDNTLFLHNVDSIYAEEYHKKVKNFLVYLKDSDKKLYIATHNFDPIDYLEHCGF